MDPFLLDRWIGDFDRVPVLDLASVDEARERARLAARHAGLPEAAVASAALVASELATNQLRHARDGVIASRVMRRDGEPGLEIIAADRGGGIADPAAALDRLDSSARGRGVGLSGVLRLFDEVDFDVRIGQGTCVWARKFATPRRQREIAILGRPVQGERVSGDDAVFVRTDDALVVALADGLGHGPEASLAARAAVEVVRVSPDRAIAQMLCDAGAALLHTRGAAMSILRIDEHNGCLRHAGVGNVTTHVIGPGSARTLSGITAVLGMSAPRTGVSHGEESSVSLGPWDVVYAFTDGLSTGTRLDARSYGGRRHPLLIADELLQAFDRKHDDSTIVVVA
jgi:anti-sigma regulatory factor (Ser/Thr protein kinase)